MSKPELVLPGGGFDGAIAALEGGADAIYLGLSRFSARKQARNFDALEYRRILKSARDRGKRIYVALNTLVLESEMGMLSEALVFLSRFAPDAVIVQDWGLAYLIRERYPDLALHASTQAAIRTQQGVAEARRAGMIRIVLPRETTALELATLHEADPGMEFEVFVHGALCYSYSGLCLASGLTLGRSGNRGECAQLCRSWYAGNGAGLRGRGHWFSCRDLDLSEDVAALGRAGACSFKVEGRMKSPEYAYSVARLYRTAIDRAEGEGGDEAEHGALRSRARRTFSRSTTRAWIGHHAGADILDAGFPGHRGLPVGRIVSILGLELRVALDGALALRDGLQLLGPERRGELTGSLQFSLRELRLAQDDRPVFEAEAGQEVILSLPDPVPGSLRPAKGDTLFRISAREMDRRAVKSDSFEPCVISMPARLTLAAKEAGAVFSLDCELPPETVPSGLPIRIHIEDSLATPLDRARNPGGMAKARAVLAECSDHVFCLALPEALDAAIAVDRSIGIEADWLFVPPSALKGLRNRLYSAVQARLEDIDRSYAAGSADWASQILRARAGTLGSSIPERPPRAALTFPDSDIPGGLPFATQAWLASDRPCPPVAGRVWLPLAPVVAHDEGYLDAARDRVFRELGLGSSVVVGLDAMHHLPFSRELHAQAVRLGAGDRLAFFADIHLYVSNRLALIWLAQAIPSFAFAYRWIEAEDETPTGLPVPGTEDPLNGILCDVGKDFAAPLFISKACLLRHHVAGGSCPAPCAKRLRSRVSDRGRNYVAVVEECISMLFMENASPKGVPGLKLAD